MASFVIHGGRKLQGEVRVSGAKNAILPVMAAAVLTSGECIIRGVPDIKDVTTMVDILTSLGVRVWVGGDRQTGQRYVRIMADSLNSHEVSSELMSEMRSSIVLMGALVGRLGRVRVSRPGGCRIGLRPINFHLSGLTRLGVTIDQKHGFIDGQTPRLVGKEIHLDFPSVTTTENIMMAAVYAEGTTVIRNPAREPEVVDLQNFLNAMGARIVGAGSDTIRIQGVRALGSVEHTIIPDRIEAGTYLAAAAATGGEVTVTNVIPEHLDAVLAKLREAGVNLDVGRDSITVRGGTALRAVDFNTLPHPGFPTDMQPQVMALMCLAEGTSLIVENIFENRFAHVEEFQRMGATIDVGAKVAVVRGTGRLSGAQVRAGDLRAGAALVVAGLAAEGTTVVSDIYHIERGYEKMDEKLRSLGAEVTRRG